MAIELIGWDLGGAHLKAAALDRAGQILALAQEPCPLWQGMERLYAALERVFARWTPPAACRHAVTMTGELADLFEHREQGVLTLVAAMREHCPPGSVRVFAGPRGFLAAAEVVAADAEAIASANWLASGYWAAAKLGEALFVDVGSTTTDVLPIHDFQARNRGYTDCERMRYDELIYSGIVRTPVSALAGRAPFEGEWIGLMAEYFATTADVYRLTGELPEHADRLPAADGGAKTEAGSRRRLARMFGRDAESATPGQWRQAARYLRGRQLDRLGTAIERQLSLGFLQDAVPFAGAGVGRFLVRELAARMGHPYLDFSDIFFMTRPQSDLSSADCAFMTRPQNDLSSADCAPATAVACLALREGECT